MKKFVGTRKTNSCSNFKPLNDSVVSYRKGSFPSCRECMYFSSRNCRMDIADSIDTDMDYF